MILLAATAVAAAVVLALPSRPYGGVLRSPDAPGPGESPGRLVARRGAPVLLGSGSAAALLAGLPVRVVALAAVLAAAAWATRSLVVRRSRRREAAAAADRVRETCESLAADLAAGRPPGPALDRAGEVWPALAPVVTAYDVGADVPAALRTLATRPGCGDLRHVAAAWDVAHRTGHGLADAVARVATAVRSRQATRRVVTSELASARSTARLLAGLPVLALLMGTGAGGDPWSFLLTTGPGVGCMAAGLALAYAGLWWIETIADGVEAAG